MPWIPPRDPIAKSTASWVQAQGLCLMPTQPADEFRIFAFVSIIGPRHPQGFVQLPLQT